MNETIQGMIERIKADPRTTVIAIISASSYGAGEALRAIYIEPWGSILIGVGGLLAGGALLFTKFAPSKPQ